MQAISKRFGDTVALEAVDFHVPAGQAHALLGENGAGKTTLMRVLYGLVRADHGRIFLHGRQVDIRSPADARGLGVGMVHQHFTLVPTLTVAENILLGAPQMPTVISPRRAAKLVRPAIERYLLQVDASAVVGDLTVGGRQKVEILKALFRDARLLVLDEPTSVLAPQEIDQLFETIRRLKAEGRSVVFISHKLREITSVCDEVTVLRAGRRVGNAPVSQITHDDLARMMTGSRLPRIRPRAARPPGDVVLETQGLTVPPVREKWGVRSADLSVRSGEILGVAGIEGNGQITLSEAVCGLRKASAGRVRIAGQDMTGRPPAEVFALGVAHIPDDRHAQAVVLDMSLRDNLILKSNDHSRFSKAGLLNRRLIRRHAQLLVAGYDVKTPSTNVPIRSLSGGNQQKAVLAREFSGRPALIVAVNPARGLDIAATKFLYDKLVEQRDRGAAVLLVSADLDELMQVSDRIAVMYEGVPTMTPWPAADRETLGRQMLGLDTLARPETEP